jgi:PQQ-like domain
VIRSAAFQRASKAESTIASARRSVDGAHAAPATHRIEDLALWRRNIRGVEFAVRSPSTSRPNPLIADSLVIASIWSPGAICALDRDTGQLRWRHPMAPLAHESVLYADGLLYAHDLHSLYALDPESGKTAWSWRPPDDEDEPLHGSPSVDKGRLFIGDRLGRFWCLDAQTGAVFWQQEPSPGEGPINATAIAMGDRVIIGTDSALAVAYRAGTGEEIWRQQLDGPCNSEIFRFKGRIALRTFWSVFVIEPKDGQIAERWHWRGRFTKHLVCARDSLLVVTQRAYEGMTSDPTHVLRASMAGEPRRMVVGISDEGETFQQPCPRQLLGLRWSSETGLVYESRADGLGILDPRTGERLHDIVSGSDPSSVHCGPVDVRDGVVYMLGLRGAMHAIRHPERPHARRRAEPLQLADRQKTSERKPRR